MNKITQTFSQFSGPTIVQKDNIKQPSNIVSSVAIIGGTTLTGDVYAVAKNKSAKVNSATNIEKAVKDFIDNANGKLHLESEVFTQANIIENTKNKIKTLNQQILNNIEAKKISGEQSINGLYNYKGKVLPLVKVFYALDESIQSSENKITEAESVLAKAKEIYQNVITKKKNEIIENSKILKNDLNKKFIKSLKTRHLVSAGIGLSAGIATVIINNNISKSKM